MRTALTGIRRELGKDGAILLPLRLFMGVGWLRATAEKVVEPGWWDGREPAALLEERLAEGSIVFHPYRALVVDVLLPNARAVGWLVMAAELMVGVAILIGLFTSLALLVAMFLNFHFICAGEPNPSAFYIVIQIALLVSGVGVVLGLDARLDRIRSPLLVAKNVRRSDQVRIRKRHYLLLGVLCAVAAVYAALHVSTLEPGPSVKDPAMILAVLFSFAALQVLISYLRQAPLQGQRCAAVAGFGHARSQPGQGGARALAEQRLPEPAGCVR